MKIKKIDLHSLRNDEHFQFGTEFGDLVYKHPAVKAKIAARFTEWLRLHDREDEALKKIVKSAITEEILDADRRRDGLFRGMSDAARSALNHFDPAVRAAARRLGIVFETYGNVAAKPLNEESSAVYNLLKELTDNHAADVGKVGLGEWVTELEAANVAFGALTQGRYEESSRLSDVVLKRARTEADASYRSIAERIDALALVEGDSPDAPYGAFTGVLNAVIEKYGNILARRQGRAAKR